MTAKLTGFTQTDVTEFFAYLDDLRESGVTNMFGAGPYVEEEFELSKKAARLVVTAWMGTFDKTEPEVRAAKALADT